MDTTLEIKKLVLIMSTMNYVTLRKSLDFSDLQFICKMKEFDWTTEIIHGFMKQRVSVSVLMRPFYVIFY